MSSGGVPGFVPGADWGGPSLFTPMPFYHPAFIFALGTKDYLMFIILLNSDTYTALTLCRAPLKALSIS